VKHTAALALVAILAGAAVASAEGPGPVPPEPAARAAWAERWIDDWIAGKHADPALFDRARLLKRARDEAPPGESGAAFENRLGVLVESAYYSFAPLDAQPDPSVRYRLPFPLDVPRFLVQGVGGAVSHQGVHRYAFDFAMPVGSDVLAARAGTVARVRDGFGKGGLDPGFVGKDNTVYVLHDDGTFATYTHLQKGIPVREGDRVAPGGRIGASGQSGFSGAPHLHFAVYRRNAASTVETVPIRFGVGSAVGFVPKEREFYGGSRRRTVQLAVTAEGHPCDENNPLRLVKGGETALSVSLVAPGGAAQDVTHDTRTRYLAPTAWSVNVDAQGVVRGTPSPDYAAAQSLLPPHLRSAGTGWGVVVVTHEDAESGRYGFASVPVLIGDGAR
jgi:murein DD-endopeptidase MepM/ murein hydrolase activator NlpD